MARRADEPFLSHFRFFLTALLLGVLLSGSGCFGSAPVRPTAKKSLVPKSYSLSTPFYCPLKNVHVLSYFGRRDGRYHTGIDLRGRRGGGDYVYAAREGTVTKVTVMRGYGNIVIMQHADGFKSRYAHLRKALVKVGQRLEVGDQLGIVGQTGRATTAHLHFEIINPLNQFVDPAPFIFRKVN